MKDTALNLLAKILAKPVVANAIIKFAKKRPYSHIGEYMERYWVIEEDSWLSRILGISIRLHVIKLPDQDRAMHTHPFNFRSFILTGGYVEIRRPSNSPQYYYGFHDHYPGSTYLLDRTTPHQIVRLMGKEAVTLFVYDTRKGDWYFDTDEGLIPHAKYLNEEPA